MSSAREDVWILPDFMAPCVWIHLIQGSAWVDYPGIHQKDDATNHIMIAIWYFWYSVGDWSSLVKQAILPCNVLRDCCDNLPWGESLCDSGSLYQMIWRGMTMNVSAMLLHSNKALCLFRVTSLLTHRNENGTQHIGQWCKLLRCMRDVLWCIQNTLWSSCGIVPAWWELFVYAMPILWHWSYREFAVARVWAWQTRKWDVWGFSITHDECYCMIPVIRIISQRS